MSEPPTPTPQPTGIVQSLVDAAKNLTLTNILIIALLAAILIPSYLIYTVVNDPVMMGRWLSSYEEIHSDTGCVIRVASLSGGGDEYAISSGFAAQGNDRYVISVLMDRKPSEVEVQSYCATVTAIVDHMRRPEAPSPTFPNSDEPVISHYPADGSP